MSSFHWRWFLLGKHNHWAMMSLSFRRASSLCLKTVIWRCWSGRLQLRKDCQTFPYILNLITCPETHTVELSFILSLLSDVTGFRKLYNPVEHYKRLLYSYVLQVFFYCEVFKFTVNRRQTEVFRSFEYRETRKHYFILLTINWCSFAKFYNILYRTYFAQYLLHILLHYN